MVYFDKFTSRKERVSSGVGFESVPDSLVAWMDRYLHLVIRCVRSEAVTKKVALHLDRFAQFFTDAYGHDRNRAIVFVLLSTGLRREELVRLNLDQIEPETPEELRRARKGRITRVKGKGKTERIFFLSADARCALARSRSIEEARAPTGDTGLCLTWA